MSDHIKHTLQSCCKLPRNMRLLDLFVKKSYNYDSTVGSFFWNSNLSLFFKKYPSLTALSSKHQHILTSQLSELNSKKVLMKYPLHCIANKMLIQCSFWAMILYLSFTGIHCVSGFPASLSDLFSTATLDSHWASIFWSREDFTAQPRSLTSAMLD